jgi:hypothetical protein
MPSGSHGGSAGGHSSGGASFGGGRSFGGGGYHSRPVRVQPYYFPFFGHTYVIGTQRHNHIMSLVGGAFLVGFVFVICLVMSLSQTDVKKIKEDRDYYLNMIDTAQAEQIIDAKVKGQFLGEGGKYYITYNIELPNGSYLWSADGYSFSMYSMAEASAIYRNGTIQVVVDGLPLTGETDSIPLDYRDFELDDDGSYTAVMRRTKIMRVMSYTAGAALLILLFFIVKLTFSHKQTEEESKAAAIPAGAEQGQGRIYCAYCGGVMEAGRDSCPRCGSRTKK